MEIGIALIVENTISFIRFTVKAAGENLENHDKQECFRLVLKKYMLLTAYHAGVSMLHSPASPFL